MNDAPSNLHQVTAVTLLDPDAGGERKVRYCCASFFVIFLQMAAVLGVYLGVEKPSCLKSADCARGDFCLPEGRCNQCWWGAYLLCDDGSGVANEGQVLNSVCFLFGPETMLDRSGLKNAVECDRSEQKWLAGS